jgi:hypothetical protein
MAENLEYFFGVTVGQGTHPGSQVCGGKVGGKPGQTLLQAPIFNTYFTCQQLNEVTGIIAIGRQAALREQADFLDRQVIDFNIRAKKKYFGSEEVFWAVAL